jgi:hypothetical protein
MVRVYVRSSTPTIHVHLMYCHVGGFSLLYITRNRWPERARIVTPKPTWYQSGSLPSSCQNPKKKSSPPPHLAAAANIICRRRSLSLPPPPTSTKPSRRRCTCCYRRRLHKKNQQTLAAAVALAIAAAYTPKTINPSRRCNRCCRRRLHQAKTPPKPLPCLCRHPCLRFDGHLFVNVRHRSRCCAWDASISAAYA